MQTLTPKALARAIGVSESSLKRWADDGLLRAERTAGGHRRIDLAEAVRFIRRTGARVVQPAALGMSELAEADLPDTVRREPTELLHQALEDGDGAQARSIVLSLYMSGWSPARIFDGPLRESMRRIGELWQHAEWGIVVEHRAVDVAVGAINQLRVLAPARGIAPPIALGGAIGSDPYQVPTLMAATVLGDLGYLDINLGARTPVGVLGAAAERYRPQIVWMAASVLLEHGLANDAAALAARLHDAGMLIVVGGRGFDAVDRLPIGVVRAATMETLEALGRGLQHAGQAGTA